jgi:gliding motility-associated-like protein
MRKILRGHVFNIRVLFTLCLGVAFLSETHAQVSGTFTINSAVATGGGNFQTFSAAVASLAGGVNGAVTFNVQSGSGPYNEQVIINAIIGTSATNTITFNCNGVTLTFLSTNSNQRAVVKLNGADYVTFDNLTVNPQAASAGQYGYGFHLLNDADNNTIKNCRINNFNDYDNTDDHAGIVINGNDGISYDLGTSNCDNNLIQNNIITGGSYGVTLNSIPASGAAVFMTGNKVIGNTISDFDVYGIQMYYNDGAIIDGNDISGGPDAVYTFNGIFLDYFNLAFNITNNRIHGFQLQSGNNAYAIYISSLSAAGKECTISNNLIYDFKNDLNQFGIYSIITQPLWPYGTSYLNIYNNTISLDDQTVSGASAYGIYFTDTITNVNVMNNIITISRKSTAENLGMYFRRPPKQYASQRNVVYVAAGSASTAGVGRYNGVVCNTMVNWQKKTGFDYYSTDVTPLYTNLAGFNFRPTAQAIDNMAAYVGINTDITGAARNTTNPDPGCYEFTSPACSTPITGGVPNVLPDTILCAGPKISLGLTGNSAGGGQTYVWQTSTSSTGTYTNVTSPLGYPYYETTPATTLYYRVALTCGGSTAYSSPVRVLVNTSLNGGTYTINSALPTGGINFNSFADVVSALQCSFNGSLVFNVQPGSGPYNEQFILPSIATSPTKTITINGNGATITYAPTNSNQSAVVKLDGADYITIDSLNVNVQGATTFGFGIQLLNDADHNTIKRCTVNLNKTAIASRYVGILINALPDDPTAGAGIYKSNCDTNLIANNTVNGGCYGIVIASNSQDAGFSNCSGNIVTNNTLKDNSQNGIFLRGASYTLIDSNDISQPTRTTFEYFQGICLTEVNYGVTITKNKIHNLGENLKTNNTQFDGIRANNVTPLSTDPIIVSNNLIYTFRGSGLQYGINNFSSDYMKYYHNTISLDDSASGGISLTNGYGTFRDPSVGTELKDNIFVIRRGGTGPKYGVYTNINDSGLIANYNNYYIGSYTGPNFIGYMTQDYPTLADWIKVRKDSNSISLDPVFFDAAKADYTPTKILFENKGINVGVTTDLLNAARNPTNPDMGAIEFTICRPLTNPVVRVEETGTNFIKFGWDAVPNTTGYRVSRDGITWSTPSSGALGLTHTVTGLRPTDTVGLMVKALGTRVDCPEYYSKRLVDTALTDGVFIPNTFTPNNDNKNDKFKVYSNTLSSVRWMVFNQWGEKVFEASDKSAEWDGYYKGKPQPIGVYIYVVSGTLTDGSKVTRKGTFNLVR